VWNNQGFRDATAWNKSGRSAAERILVGAYADGARPEIRTGSGHGVRTANSSATLNNVAIVGVRFYADTWGGDPTNPMVAEGPCGIYILRTGQNFLVEDCSFERFSNNILLNGFPTSIGYQNFVLRRNILLNPLRTDAGNTNLFMSGAESFRIEENLFAQTAANETAGNKLSHNMYIEELCRVGDNRVRGNIFYNGRSNCTVRINCDVFNNLSIRGGQGAFLGYAGSPAFVSGRLRGNVITESRNHWNGQGLGQAMGCDRVDNSSFDHNLILNSTDGSNHTGFVVGSTTRQISISDNIFYNWTDRNDTNNVSPLIAFDHVAPGPIRVAANDFAQPRENWIFRAFVAGSLANATFIGNRYNAQITQPFYIVGVGTLTVPQWRSSYDTVVPSTIPAYPDPTRSVGRYYAEVVGGQNTTEAFILSAAAQSRATWDTRLTAAGVNAWLRAGFGMAEPVP